MAALCAGRSARADDAQRTTRLEAAVVSKLPQFVEWPAMLNDARPTFDLCVGPPDPFGALLVDLVAGTAIDRRPLTTRQTNRERDLAGCRVLYLPARAGGPHPLLQAARLLPILTVGDDRSFLDQGGIVGLRVVNGRVRFDIDLGAAHRVGLRISAQLLSLAVSVRGTAS